MEAEPRDHAGHAAGSSSGIAMVMEITAHCQAESREGRELGLAELAGEMLPATLVCAGAALGVPAQGPSCRHPLLEPRDSLDRSKSILAAGEALSTPCTYDKARGSTGQYIKMYVQSLKSHCCQIIINSYLQLSPISLTQLPIQSNCHMRFL